jgi:digeranylgeranylglycerophospholipid reductase
VVLDRSRFDQSLADQARRLGADVRTHTEAVGLLRDGDFIRGIQARDHAQKRTYHIKAKVTVGADGIEGFVGRWAGLTGHLNAGEIHSAIQYLLEADEIPRDTIEIYAGQEIAPGGYAWVFPKGNGLGNVGLAAHPQMLKMGTTKDYLERFVAQHFPKARIWTTIAGGTSGTEPLKTMVGNGVLLVGEAARQNNAFSGGGIMNALEGAEEAAFVIAEALKARDLTAGFLRRYDRRWTKLAGHTLSRFALLRRFFFQLDDREMDSIAGVLEGMVQKSEEGLADYAEMFKAAFKMAPGLLWKARRFLW